MILLTISSPHSRLNTTALTDQNGKVRVLLLDGHIVLLYELSGNKIVLSINST